MSAAPQEEQPQKPREIFTIAPYLKSLRQRSAPPSQVAPAPNAPASTAASNIESPLHVRVAGLLELAGGTMTSTEIAARLLKPLPEVEAAVKQLVEIGIAVAETRDGRTYVRHAGFQK